MVLVGREGIGGEEPEISKKLLIVIVVARGPRRARSPDHPSLPSALTFVVGGTRIRITFTATAAATTPTAATTRTGTTRVTGTGTTDVGGTGTLYLSGTGALNLGGTGALRVPWTGATSGPTPLTAAATTAH